MSNETKAVAPINPVVQMFKRPEVAEKFKEILGSKGTAFTASVLALATQDDKLGRCNPATVYTAAMTAATLDLPIQKNLGLAYVIPYGNDAQFQIGYKGYIQLAQRTGLYKTIAAEPIYDGQIISQDPLKGFEFDFSVRPSGKPIGYAAYFCLINGFEKTVYWPTLKIEGHRARFSKAKNSHWDSDFDSMACKTVIKQLISKYGPMSVEMQKAISLDGGIITEVDGGDLVAQFDQSEDVTGNDDRSTLIAELEAHVLDIEPTKYNAMLNILEKNEVGSFGKVRIAIAEANQKQ